MVFQRVGFLREAVLTLRYSGSERHVHEAARGFEEVGSLVGAVQKVSRKRVVDYALLRQRKRLGELLLILDEAIGSESSCGNARSGCSR